MPKTAKIKKETVKVEKNDDLSLPVYDINVKEVNNLFLPKEIFKFTLNDKLLAQSIRVYLSNQRQGTVSTKDRGEVTGSTRKIYRQKGTGKARHGSIKAPIFVGGGVVGGPKPKDYSLKINKKQKKQAIFSSLSLQLKNKNIIIFSDKILSTELKTKKIFELLKKLNLNNKKVLFVLPKIEKKFILAARNIKKVDFIDAKSINAYKILSCQKVILFESSIEEIKKKFIKK